MVSTRQNKTKHLTNLLGNGALTSTSDLEAFRDFFDIKTEHWHAFCQHLTKKIEEVPSWIELQNPVHRLTCAKVFLSDHGHQYWGNEDNRAKYLLKDRVMHEDCCFFPENEKALEKGLALLIQKMAEAHNNIRITSHFMTSATQLGGSDASTNAKSDQSHELAGTNSQFMINHASSADYIVANSNPVRRIQMIVNHFRVKKTCSPPDAVRVLFQTINSPDTIKQFAEKCTSAQVTPYGIDFYLLAPNQRQYAVVSIPWSADKHQLFNCLNDNDFFALMILVNHAWVMQEKLGVFEMSIPATLN